MYANGGNLEQILWNICLKCFFLRIMGGIIILPTLAKKMCALLVNVN